MKKYIITEKAGRMVAGRSNNGAGSVLYLSDKEAEYELSLGTLIEAPADGAQADGGNADTEAGNDTVAAGEGNDTIDGGADKAQPPEKQPANGGKGK